MYARVAEVGDLPATMVIERINAAPVHHHRSRLAIDKQGRGAVVRPQRGMCWLLRRELLARRHERLPPARVGGRLLGRDEDIHVIAWNTYPRRLEGTADDLRPRPLSIIKARLVPALLLGLRRSPRLIRVDDQLPIVGESNEQPSDDPCRSASIVCLDGNDVAPRSQQLRQSIAAGAPATLDRI